MPRGTKKIEQVAAAAKARSDAYEAGEGFTRALFLKDGETCKGRFLEEGAGLWYLYCHPLPKKPGQQYNDLTLCLDQAFTDEEEPTYVEGSRFCPACGLEGVNRTARVIVNFIRYDEPKLVRDAKGAAVKDQNNQYRFDGVEPALVVCNFATGVGSRIAYLESQKGNGISNHVVSLHKTGDKNNPWMIDIVQENKPPERWEVDLYNKKTPPPKAITQVSPKFKSISHMNVATMQQAYGLAGGGAGFGAQAPAVPSDNVYAQQSAAVAGGHMNLGAFGS